MDNLSSKQKLCTSSHFGLMVALVCIDMVQYLMPPCGGNSHSIYAVTSWWLRNGKWICFQFLSANINTFQAVTNNRQEYILNKVQKLDLCRQELKSTDYWISTTTAALKQRVIPLEFTRWLVRLLSNVTATGQHIRGSGVPPVESWVWVWTLRTLHVVVLVWYSTKFGSSDTNQPRLNFSNK